MYAERRKKGAPFAISYVNLRNKRSLWLGTDKYFFIGSTLKAALLFMKG